MNDTITVYTVNTVLESGIFAFDDKNKPIGIKGLSPAKNISGSKTNVIELKPNRLELFTLEITVAINLYLHGQPPNTLQSFYDKFENDIADTLKHWAFDTDNLEPQYSDFLKKCKKEIQKLKQYAKKMDQSDTKQSLRRNRLVSRLTRSFDEYIKTQKTDTFYYITHLLIGCGLENGNFKTVFNKIFKAEDRNLASLSN